MEKSEYQTMFDLEEDNWWYRAQRNITEVLLDKFFVGTGKVLDAGCGTGFNLIFLKKFGEISGVDISDDAIKFCKKRNLNIKKSSIENLPFKNNFFDLITSFDVIYHKGVIDDQNAINELYRVCKKNGLLFLRVPAFSFLYGSHDRQVHGIRRYDKQGLKIKLEKAGFKIEKSTYANTFLFFPTFLLRFVEKDAGDINKVNFLLNKFLFFVLNFEKYWLKYFNFPFGVSLICIARKVT